MNRSPARALFLRAMLGLTAAAAPPPAAPPPAIPHGPLAANERAAVHAIVRATMRADAIPGLSIALVRNGTLAPPAKSPNS